MKLRIGFAMLAALAILALGAPAQAAPIVFTLNCTINTSTDTCTSGGPFGTITLTDNTLHPNWVEVAVSLISPWDEIGNIYLNYSNPDHALPLPYGTDFYFVNSSGSSVGSVSDSYNNSQGPSGYDFLDISLDPYGSPASIDGYLRLRHSSTDYNLDASMFNVLDGNNLLLAAAYIGQCEPWEYVGADPPTAPIPEPGSMVLLGSGLIGLAGAIRRRMRK